MVILSTSLEWHSIATNVSIDEYYGGDAGDWEHRTAAIGGAATGELLGRGEVTYTYGANNLIATKVDAKNQKIQYTYDSYSSTPTIPIPMMAERIRTTRKGGCRRLRISR